VANSLKNRVSHPGPFRTICAKYGQLHHRVESQLSLRLLGHTASRVKPMPEEAAVKLGADVLSEVFIFSVAGTLLWYELARNAKLNEKIKQEKEQQIKHEKLQLENRLQTIEGDAKVLRQRVEMWERQWTIVQKLDATTSQDKT